MNQPWQVRSLGTDFEAVSEGYVSVTPLQFELYLDRAFTEGFRVGQKPVDADTIEAVLSPNLNGMGARLTRNGYNVKQLTDTLGGKPREVRSFLAGQLAAERTQELHDRLLAAGVPL